MGKMTKKVSALVISLAMVFTNISYFPLTAGAATVSGMVADAVNVEEAVVTAPTNLQVDNYGKYTGKYFIVFKPVEGITSYNIYVDGDLVQNVEGSGYYLKAKEVAKLSMGQHTVSVNSVDAEGYESASASTTFTVYEKGSSDDIPQIYISTQGRGISGEYFKNQGNGITDVNIAIVDNSGNNKDIIDASSDIKIRGNSTAGGEKKPYNFKLNKKKGVLGMDSSKKWSLLANAFDKSLTRNALVMKLAQEMGLDYTSDYRFVDVYCNGNYLGNYLLIESVETGKGRVEIDADAEDSNDILLELDNNGRDAAESYHLDRTGLGVLLMLNEPEIEPNDTESIALYQNKINYTKQLLVNFETALKKDDYEQISKYIDVESFAKYYIVNEFFRNQDFNFSSTRFYVKNGILYAGPCWDYDLSSGNIGNYYSGDYKDGVTYNSYLVQNMVWYKYLMENETFRQCVIDLYTQYQPVIKKIYTKDIDAVMASYGNSFARNYDSKENLGAGWSVTNPDMADAYSYANRREWKTYEDTVEFLKNWLSNRNQWLEEQWNIDDPDMPVSIVNKNGSVVVRWNDTGEQVPEYYNVTYNEIMGYNGITPITEKKTIRALATERSIIVEDLLANNTEVTVEAVYADNNSKIIGAASAKADLKITEIYFSKKYPVAGDSVQILLKVQNLGAAAAYPANDTISSTIKIDGVQIGWTANYKGPLNPNETSDYSFPVNWTVKEGSHTIQTQIDERSKVVECDESNNIKSVKFTFGKVTSSNDIGITGYQMTTSLAGKAGTIGIRTVYQREPKVNEQDVKEFGLIYGLISGGITFEDMVLDSTSKYVIYNAATEQGKCLVQMGDSQTSEYYVMSMNALAAYNQNYYVRAYAVLEDGTIAYSSVEQYNVYNVAEQLYTNNKMPYYQAHKDLYTYVLSQVNPKYEQVDYNWSKTLVDRSVSTKELKIEGYQMTATLGGQPDEMGLKVVYSAEKNIIEQSTEIGLIYGLVYNNAITSDDMLLESNSQYIVSYAATQAGVSNAKFGISDTAKYYIRTMNVTNLNSEGYTTGYMVRAYAKMSDGTVIYSDVCSYSIDDVACLLYDNDLMSTFYAHDAIYNNILKKVDAGYKEVDYNWTNTLVKN